MSQCDEHVVEPITVHIGEQRGSDRLVGVAELRKEASGLPVADRLAAQLHAAAVADHEVGRPHARGIRHLRGYDLQPAGRQHIAGHGEQRENAGVDAPQLATGGGAGHEGSALDTGLEGLGRTQALEPEGERDQQRRRRGADGKQSARAAGEARAAAVENRERAGGVGPAAPGVLGEQALDERGEPARAGGAQRAQLGRVGAAVQVRDLERRRRDEGPAAGEQLEQRDAEGVEVGGRRRFVAADLLRAHVGWGADGEAGAGQAGVGVERAEQPEVGQLGGAVGGEQHVRRLDVAVNDAGGVQVGEAGEQRSGDGDDVGDRQRAVAQAVGE